MKKILKQLDIFLVLVAVSLFTIIGEFIGDQLSLTDYFDRSLADFDYTDLYYQSGFFDNEQAADERIVLINIGRANRFEIAMMIDSLNQHNPAAIGLNAFFYFQKEDTLGDLALMDALSRVDNLTMPVKIFEEENGDSVATSHPMFIENATPVSNGFEFPEFPLAPKKVRTKREVNGEVYYHQSVQMAGELDKGVIDFIDDRGKDVEDIIYYGNIVDYGGSPFPTKYLALDFLDVIDGYYDPALIEGKLVLLTFLGEYLGDSNSFEDKFYTPMNEDLFGKSNPDMYSGVIFANIITSLLDRELPTKGHSRLNWLLNIVTALLLALIFKFIFLKIPGGYHLISKLLAFLIFNGIILGALMIFDTYQLKFEIRYLLFIALFIPDSIELVVKRLK